MLMIVSKYDRALNKFNPMDIVGDIQFINSGIEDEVPQEVIRSIIVAIEESDEVMLEESECEKIVGNCLMQSGYYDAARSYIILKFSEDLAIKQVKMNPTEEPKEDGEKEKKNKFSLFKK